MNLPKTRTEAKILGSKTYATGGECKNGHSSYRYTQSGACAICVRANNLQALDSDEHVRKLLIRENFGIVRVLIAHSDRKMLAAAAYGLAAMRVPDVRPADVDPRLPPTGDASCGVMLYTFRCHEDDVITMKEIASGTHKARPLELHMSAETRLARTLAEDVTVDPIPAWADRP